MLTRVRRIEIWWDDRKNGGGGEISYKFWLEIRLKVFFVDLRRLFSPNNNNSLSYNDIKTFSNIDYL